MPKFDLILRIAKPVVCHSPSDIPLELAKKDLGDILSLSPDAIQISPPVRANAQCEPEPLFIVITPHSDAIHIHYIGIDKNEAKTVADSVGGHIKPVLVPPQDISIAYSEHLPQEGKYLIANTEGVLVDEQGKELYKNSKELELPVLTYPVTYIYSFEYIQTIIGKDRDEAKKFANDMLTKLNYEGYYGLVEKKEVMWMVVCGRNVFYYGPDREIAESIQTDKEKAGEKCFVWATEKHLSEQAPYPQLRMLLEEGKTGRGCHFVLQDDGTLITKENMI